MYHLLTKTQNKSSSLKKKNNLLCVLFILVVWVLDQKTLQIRNGAYLWTQMCCNCDRWQQPCLSRNQNSPHFLSVHRKIKRYSWTCFIHMNVSTINIKTHCSYHILPYATYPQLFHREGPQVGQSSYHRSSNLLQSPKQKISISIKSSECTQLQVSKTHMNIIPDLVKEVLRLLKCFHSLFGP